MNKKVDEMVKNFCAKNNFSGDVPAVHRAVQSMMYDDYNLVRDIKIDEIDDFKNHPYRVVMNEDMAQLIESVKTNGVLEPITIRPKENGRWELISGHRRRFAAREAGNETIPAVIVKYDDDEATIAMVDANLRREDILPSEKAFAYKMKMDAMKRQGKRTDLTSGQFVPKSDDNRTTAQIGADTGDNYKTVQRYIRLTYLISELLDMVDSKKISFIMGVNISYLTEDEQLMLYRYLIDNDKMKLSLKQTEELKRLSACGELTEEAMLDVLQNKEIKRQKVDTRLTDKIESTLERLCAETGATRSEIVRSLISHGEAIPVVDPETKQLLGDLRSDFSRNTNIIKAQMNHIDTMLQNPTYHNDKILTDMRSEYENMIEYYDQMKGKISGLLEKLNVAVR